MIKKPTTGLAMALVMAGLQGCANVDTAGMGTGDLGEGKQEFETSSQGGAYHFQYVTEGSDGYRTVLWRQGESLSDDAADGKLVTGVVRSVFLEKYCKDLKLPVTFADGSPAPMGKEGKWTASLRCATPPPPPPKPKPEKTAKKKPPSATEPAAAPASKSAPAAKASRDGPKVCEATANGFVCKPR